MCLWKGLANSSGTTPGWVIIDAGPWLLAAQASDGFQAADTVQVTKVPATCEDRVSSRSDICRADSGSPGRETGLRGRWALAQKSAGGSCQSAGLTHWFLLFFIPQRCIRLLCEDTRMQETVSLLKGLNRYMMPRGTSIHRAASSHCIHGAALSSVQSLSRVQFFATPWTAARQASLSITNSWSLLKLTSIESVIPSNHLVLCHPLLLLPSIFPSIRIFSSESVLRIRQPKYWSFSFSISAHIRCLVNLF